MTFEDLIKNCAKTFEEMKDYGFPENVTTAFLTTADEVKSLVMSRVPGKATTMLINEGYDLKSFCIKAKSCDWGPMAGFVCELPPFNKKGAGGMEFNKKEIAEYISKLTNGEIANPTVLDKQSPCVQIKVSDERKREIINGYNVAINGEPGDQEIKGYACDKRENPTVLIQFLMKKKDDLWALYHGEIYTKNDSGVFTKYNNISAKAEGNNFKWGKLDFNSQTFSSTPNIYPIRGLMNPYPPYKGNESYKNAIAGDYDLFTVWPLIQEHSVEELERTTEVLAEGFNLDSGINSCFARSNVKKFSVYSATNKCIYIEFAPEEDEEKELLNNWINKPGHPNRMIAKILKESGNINNIIYQTAQMLNSFVQDIYMKKCSGNYPNRAFHSDEGGRPGVTEIDYP